MNIGIDLGGTNIAAAIVDAGGGILCRTSIPTAGGGGAKAIVEGLCEVCGTLLSGAAESPASIGIGVPGSVNDDTGEVIFTPNLPLRKTDITSTLKEKYRCPVHLGNDANCAAIGETIAGGAKGAKDVVFITLGTGVGGGLILNGRLHTGIGGAASEIGHMVIYPGGRKCGCGRSGCWEMYASATGLIMTAKGFMEADKDSRLWELCGGNEGRVDGRMIFIAYRTGDSAAQLAVALYTEHLAAGIVNLINVLDPEMICIGGGISNEWDALSGPIRAIVEAESFYRHLSDATKTKIVKAVLGNDAGLIGAAFLGNH